ncbi:hypothetical protein TGRH88_047190 [Toxoplasma gondii]|uniref:Uncharacterized protein n=1 Tax=Toxoplasma gondii TaxID=5811 RepID=A0A7J6K026_TOXGO|nr:hypothetical protein TGRH88_047190 [Toxoplasma gondii]
MKKLTITPRHKNLLQHRSRQHAFKTLRHSSRNCRKPSASLVRCFGGALRVCGTVRGVRVFRRRRRMAHQEEERLGRGREDAVRRERRNGQRRASFKRKVSLGLALSDLQNSRAFENEHEDSRGEMQLPRQRTGRDRCRTGNHLD